MYGVSKPVLAGPVPAKFIIICTQIIIINYVLNLNMTMYPNRQEKTTGEAAEIYNDGVY